MLLQWATEQVELTKDAPELQSVNGAGQQHSGLLDLHCRIFNGTLPTSVLAADAYCSPVWTVMSKLDVRFTNPYSHTSEPNTYLNMRSRLRRAYQLRSITSDTHHTHH